jgi:hypothetical protein
VTSTKNGLPSSATAMPIVRVRPGLNWRER